MRLKDIVTLPRLDAAIRMNGRNPKTVVFVTTLLRPREIKLASALRGIGWKVILLYKRTTPFHPERHFDLVFRADTPAELHRLAMRMQPRLCHVFSGAIDETLLTFVHHKPGPVVVDLNDVFAPSLFNYLHERFEPTRDCLARADGFVARDLQGRFAEREDGFELPDRTILFPEYSWHDGPSLPDAAPKRPADEVHVVSVGTFTLEKDGMYDSAHLQLARMLTGQGIHLHIYPHWFFQDTRGSVFRHDVKDKLVDFYRLAEETPYFHIHQSLHFDALAKELPQYDFGIVAGAAPKLGQKLDFLKQTYMRACYSGRISDFLDARLPVLINSEVDFNTKLLSHYGIRVDLDAIDRPGFKDYLLARKADPELKAAVDRAAEAMGLAHNAPRLAVFYEEVMALRHDAVRVPALQDSLAAAETKLQALQQDHAELNTAHRALQDSHTALQGAHSDLVSRFDALQDAHMALQEAHTGLETRFADLQGAHAAAEQHIAELIEEGRRQRLDVATARADGISGALEIYRDIDKPEADQLIGLLNWTEMADRVEREQGFGELVKMIKALGQAADSEIGVMSAAWKLLARKHFDELLRDGSRRFKRTIALNYFTFAVAKGDPQITALEGLLDEAARFEAWDTAVNAPDDPDVPVPDQKYFRYHLALLWQYARSKDAAGLCDALEEPVTGDPIAVPIAGKRVTQDLSNSILEANAILEGGVVQEARAILEIGGGYGRLAPPILHAAPEAKYVMVDLLPALYLAQRYLSVVFPESSVFRARAFDDFEDVRAEFEAADLAFLLPHQLEMLPDGYFDVAINVSSFGEMTEAQIETYFGLVDRLTTRQFYSKQWRESPNPFDGLRLTETDYPLRPHWTTVYHRTIPHQPSFFEALYDLGTPDR